MGESVQANLAACTTTRLLKSALSFKALAPDSDPRPPGAEVVRDEIFLAVSISIDPMGYVHWTKGQYEG